MDPLQFALSANRSADDAVNVALHLILLHSTPQEATLRSCLWTQ